MAWNPDAYNKFKTERYAPFSDLLALITVKPNLKVLDLGCGTGELTRKLADALPGSQVTGIDASAEMLAKAGEYANENVRFQQQSIEDAIQQGGGWDLVFSNAAIQWVGDHYKLLPGIIALVNKGGQLAIQLPSNHSHLTHTAIKNIAGAEPYRSALNGWTRSIPVLSIEEYAQLLFANNGYAITVFEKAYPHVLKDATALVEWTSGTALLPYIERLPEALRASFMQQYTDVLTAAVPQSPVFYPFKRTIMSAFF